MKRIAIALMMIVALVTPALATPMSEAIHEDRSMTAIHEAGHAIVAESLGARVVKVSIIPDYEQGYAGITLYAAPENLSKISSAAIAYAGMLAQIIYKQNQEALGETFISTDEDFRNGASSDLAAIEKLGLSPEEKKQAKMTSLNILKARWVDVRILAVKLLAKGKVEW